MKKFEIYGKDHKRAYRRHCARKKFKRRAKLWGPMWTLDHTYGSPRRIKSNAEIWEEIKKGEIGTFLRTMGTPCSCDCCSPSFKREVKGKIQQEIYNMIFELEK